jgi:hypothetical protein
MGKTTLRARRCCWHRKRNDSMHPDNLITDSAYAIEWMKQLNAYSVEHRLDEIVFLRMKISKSRLLICGIYAADSWGCDVRRCAIPWKAIRSIEELVK